MPIASPRLRAFNSRRTPPRLAGARSRRRAPPGLDQRLRHFIFGGRYSTVIGLRCASHRGGDVEAAEMRRQKNDPLAASLRFLDQR